MSHSKGTTNYNLPLFTKDDRPAWLTDFNSAMLEVDDVMKRTSDAARPDLLEAAQQEAAAALDKATDAQTKANGALQKSGGAMNGTLDMNEHALTNVQEIELPTSGNGLYLGSVVQPDGTGGARLTGITGNGAAFVKPDTQDSYVPVRVGTPQTGDDAVNKNSLNGTLSSYMKKSGATMTGALMLSGEPTENLQAATKKYVDDAVANVPTPTGGITQEQADARYVQLAGSTMTGDLKVLESPQSDASAVSKSYAQGLFAGAVNTANAAKQAADAALPKSGGTMTGALTLAGPPTADLDAATKQYVDSKTETLELLWEGVPTTSQTVIDVASPNITKFKGLYISMTAAILSSGQRAFVELGGRTIIGTGATNETLTTVCPFYGAERESSGILPRRTIYISSSTVSSMTALNISANNTGTIQIRGQYASNVKIYAY